MSSTPGPKPHNVHPDPASIRLLILDCDGVLTDGSIVYTNEGHEIKAFNVRDGLGLRCWQREGGLVAIVTGRGGEALRRRASELGIEHLLEGVQNKADAVRTLCSKLGIPAEQTAAMGDDWPDLGMFDQCAMAIAPADAHRDVLARAHLVTKATGGQGAVREAIEFLLNARGALDRVRAATQGTDAR